MIIPGPVIATGALAFVLVAILTEGMRRTAIRHGLLDQPRADRRHRRATPYLGGAAITSGTVCAFMVASRTGGSKMLVIILAAVVVSALGLMTIRP